MANLLKCLIPTIGSPQTLNGTEGRYELAAFYCELLGMQIVNEPWLLIADDSDSGFYLAFDRDGWAEQRPPRWPDPEYPQQMHLDIGVPDVNAAGERVVGRGARLLKDNEGFRVYADPAGHPFCLYADASAAKPVVSRLVFDCFSPRTLASFYEGFLQARGRLDDTAERVVVVLDGGLPDLAFQHAQFRAARWPDPDYPAQLHVDYRWHDSLTARIALERAERFGAIRLPQLADTEIYADPASHPFCIQDEIPMVFDIAGLYLNPPEFAMVYCVDQTSQLRTVGQTHPAPTMLSTPERHADDPLDVIGMLGRLAIDDSVSTSQHRTAEFQRFLTEIDSTVPSHLAVNLVCDRDDIYESPAIQTYLADHQRFDAHRNPPGIQWYRQVERWLAYLAEELSNRADRTSVPVLEAAIRSWAQAWNTGSKPFVWIKTADQILDSLDRLGTNTRQPGATSTARIDAMGRIVTRLVTPTE